MSRPSATVSVKPVVLRTDPARGADLEVRVTAPRNGAALPVIVFSHGYGWSMTGYDPLVDHWASHGYTVVQPTHLDSRTLAVPPEDPRTPDIWRWRIRDLRTVIDHLEDLAEAVPGLSGRLDPGRVAVAGHSWGATSVSALLGARVMLDGQADEDMSDPRVRAGVLLALAGHGEDDLTPFAAEHLPFMSPDFTHMTAPALVVAGDKDQSLLTTRGPDWWSDGYHQSPGPKALLTLTGAEHSLGGIPGYTVTETTDESPERVAVLARATTAYLDDVFGGDASGWDAVQQELAGGAGGFGTLEVK